MMKHVFGLIAAVCLGVAAIDYFTGSLDKAIYFSIVAIYFEISSKGEEK